MRVANARSWSEISWELTTEVVETNFEMDGVMIRSSKEDLVWFESCRVGELICCVKQVEFSKSASEVPGRLKSPEIIRRSAASVPRVARTGSNLSLSEGIYPSSFKHALVQPLLKKPSLSTDDLLSFVHLCPNFCPNSKLLSTFVFLSTLSNFCPNSNLHFISKISPVF